MTLKRIKIEAAQIEHFIAANVHAERITDASRVYSVEHPEHGHTIVVLHANGHATAFADQVRFLPGGTEPNETVGFVEEDHLGTPVSSTDELLDRVRDNLTRGRISGAKPDLGDLPELMAALDAMPADVLAEGAKRSKS